MKEWCCRCFGKGRERRTRLSNRKRSERITTTIGRKTRKRHKVHRASEGTSTEMERGVVWKKKRHDMRIYVVFFTLFLLVSNEMLSTWRLLLEGAVEYPLVNWQTSQLPDRCQWNMCHTCLSDCVNSREESGERPTPLSQKRSLHVNRCACSWLLTSGLLTCFRGALKAGHVV